MLIVMGNAINCKVKIRSIRIPEIGYQSIHDGQTYYWYDLSLPTYGRHLRFTKDC